MKTKLLLTLMLMLALSLTAEQNPYVFEDGNFYYKITGSKTVAVTCGGDYDDPESYLGTYTGYYLPVIPENVTYRGVTYTVTAIDDNAFAWSRYMEYVEIPNTVECIGFQAFNGCNGLERAIIPSSVTRIVSAAYSFCYDLKEVTIGSSLEKIGQSAFGYCDRLSTVVCEAQIPPILDDDDTSVLYGDCFSSYASATLYVPSESLEAYQESDIWGRFSRILPIGGIGGTGDVDGNGVIAISDATFLVDLLLDGNNSLPAFYDVNGDGNVTIGDVTDLIDLLMNNN